MTESGCDCAGAEGRGRYPREYALGVVFRPCVGVYSDPQTQRLLEQVIESENMRVAWRQVKRNGGAAGTDGRNIKDTAEFLRRKWPELRQRLLDGTYCPRPVLRVEIPKPGGGVRNLGIPTVVDRLVQQAVSQVLMPVFDPEFSENSYGFRPGRSAHGAILKARDYQKSGKRWGVDMDLKQFFDEVDHDILMSRLGKQIKSLVDDLDKELERRGHSFCRYANDCNIYVASRRAGKRVLQSVTEFVEGQLKLKVNRAKSAVDRPWRRTFLGFSFTHPNPERIPEAVPLTSQGSLSTRAWEEPVPFHAGESEPCSSRVVELFSTGRDEGLCRRTGRVAT
jgi:RNA-directed DNA polymerase